MRTIAAKLVAGDTILLNGVEREVTLARPYKSRWMYIELEPVREHESHTDLIVPNYDVFETVELDTVAKVAILSLVGAVASILGVGALAISALVTIAIVTLVR